MKPGNTFSLSGTPEAEDRAVQGAQGFSSPGALPDYLSEWYQGYAGPDQTKQKQTEQEENASSQVPYPDRGNLFQGDPPEEDTDFEEGVPAPEKKVKIFAKTSFQVFTVAFLIIIAGLAGGFFYIDRKINLAETQDSLSRMTEAMAQESEGALNTPFGMQSVSPLERSKEYEPDYNSGGREPREFNASGNTNVGSSALSPEVDSDQDGLSDAVEENLGTNPFSQDTDGDGYPDGTEVNNGYSPLEPAQKKAASMGIGSENSAIAGEATSSLQSCSVDSPGGCSVSQSASMPAGQDPEVTQGSSGAESLGQISMDDYNSLTQFGLSTGEVDRVASGLATDTEKIQMQERIMGSDLMQDSLSTLVAGVPNLGLPEISDAELNIFSSQDKKDIGQYFADLSMIMQKHLGSYSNMNSEAVRNSTLNGDDTVVLDLAEAFSNVYEELKALPVPEDAKEVHKGFVMMYLMYARLFETGIHGTEDEVPLLISQMKAFEDWEPMMYQKLQALADKYGLDISSLARTEISR